MTFSSTSTDPTSAALEAASPTLVVNDKLRIFDLTAVRFAETVLARGISHTAVLGWSTAAASLDALAPSAVATTRAEWGESTFADVSLEVGAACFVHAVLRTAYVTVSLGAFDPETIDAARAWLLDRVPRASPTDEKDVAVSFWSANATEPRSRMIGVTSWSEIAPNYPATVRDQIGALLETRFDADAAGRLILWHGEPGLGKTYVVRALAWAWRDWCDLHYVTDPEAFFGNADYMLEVLLDEPENPMRWRLLVLEDTGELLSADAKQRTGQGLSRFLNVVDGIIGQGLPLLVLVTTNEDLRRLHPAVARPGRCAARIQFLPFNAEEAAAWLRAHGAEPSGAGLRTLAELYAMLAGAEPVARTPIGFGV